MQISPRSLPLLPESLPKNVSSVEQKGSFTFLLGNVSVPRALDVRQKAGWVSLLFLMNLYNKGKEYAKVLLHDS